MTDPAALSSPAALRNRDAIRDALAGLLPPHGLVLEIGSGTGEHVTHFAAAFPSLIWQPSDPDPDAIASINAHAEPLGLANLRMPLRIDARETGWPPAQADVIYCANVIHIAPWAVAEGLLMGAARGLSVGGMLLLYGPFMRGGAHTAPSNAQFDAALRAQDPEWGVRDLDAVAATAAEHGLSLSGTIEMPANNLIVVLRPGLQRARIRGPRQVPLG